MKRILCPTDLSPPARNATVYAAKLAQTIQAELILFYVQAYTESIGSLASTVEYAQEKLQTIMQRESYEVSAVFKISCYAEVTQAAQSITDVIAQKGNEFDLIVMGTNGEDDFVSFIAGSHTYRVAKKTNVPLLLIPATTSFIPIRLLVFAYDYLRSFSLPVNKLMAWSEVLKAEIMVLEILEESYSEMQDAQLKALQVKFKTSFPEISFDTIHTSDSATALHAYALRNQANWIVVCTSNDSLIHRITRPRVIRKLTQLAKYPLLIIHPETQA